MASIPAQQGRATSPMQAGSPTLALAAGPQGGPRGYQYALQPDPATEFHPYVEKGAANYPMVGATKPAYTIQNASKKSGGRLLIPWDFIMAWWLSQGSWTHHGGGRRDKGQSDGHEDDGPVGQRMCV